MYGFCYSKWCVGGDFNVVRYVEEKSNGGRTTQSMKDFDSFIRETELKDIKMSNGQFTWSSLRENVVCTRIDRFLFSKEWKENFSVVREEALFRNISDQCPVLLDISNEMGSHTIYI